MDYNKTTRHWFDRFTGFPKNGSQCVPHIFSTGDTAVTNVGVFTWSMAFALWDQIGQSPSKPKAGSLNDGGDTGLDLSYAASSLDWCDIWDIQLAVDIVFWKSSISTTIQCFDSPATVAQAVVYGGYQDNDIYRQDAPGTTLANWSKGLLVRYAGEDALAEMKALAKANASAPTMMSIRAQLGTGFCPKQLLTNKEVFMDAAVFWNLTWCSPEDISSIPIEIDLVNEQYLPGSPSREWLTLFQPAANNAFQAMIAAVRFDLGNPMPNNPLVNGNVFNATFAPPLVTVNATTGRVTAAQGQVFQNWEANPIFPYAFPVVPVFVVPYLCTLTVWKSPASAFIAILVATLSISGSAWGLAMLALTFFVKRNKPDADYCEYHTDFASANSGKHSNAGATLKAPTPDSAVPERNDDNLASTPACVVFEETRASDTSGTSTVLPAASSLPQAVAPSTAGS